VFNGDWLGMFAGDWFGGGDAPIVLFPRGGHNDDDEVMGIVLAFMGVINGRT